jgi:hypothetical protein
MQVSEREIVMRTLFSLFLLGFAVTSCQNAVTPPLVGPDSNEKTNNIVCSSAQKVVRVPQEFQTIEEALSANRMPETSKATPVPNSNPSATPTSRLVIQVAYKAGGYLLKDGLIVDTPCTDLIGISENGQKPILRREEFGEYEQPVVKIAASNVLLKGFEIKGKYTSNVRSGPSGVLILIREDETNVPGYSTISIEENDINNIGFQYPADQNKCWESGSYVCGGGHGIEIKSNSSNPIANVIVRGNKIHDLHLGQSEALTISNNVNDFAVTDNEIYDVDNIGIDIAGFQDGKRLAATKGKVISNRIYKSNAKDNPGQLKTYPWIAGIYIDGGRGLDLGEGALRVERNVVYDYGFGIEIGTEKSGEKVDNVVVEQNLIFKNWIVGIGVGHNDSNQKSYVENCILRNNTLYQNHRSGDDAGELRLTKHEEATQPLKNIRYENNLIADLGRGRCLVYADVQPELEKFDLTFTNNLFVGTASKFWKCATMDFQQFNSLTSINLQSNEFQSDYPFEKELPTDPTVIIQVIRAGTIKDFFKPKPFAAGRGISW